MGPPPPPPPPRGGGGGGPRRRQRLWHTPLPNPPPQGGRERARIRDRKYKTLLVVADGGADHFAGDRQEFLIERTHQHHRPFHQARDLVEQPLILDQLKTLREGKLLGIGQDDVLAARRIEHDFCRLQLGLVIPEAAHADRRRRHEAVAEGGLAGLDAVDGEFHHLRRFGFQPESGDDGMQRPHPLQRAGFCRARAPAHRFRPGKGADDHGQNIGEHVDRGAAGFFDQRNVEIALLRVTLDLGLIQRSKAGSLQKTLDRRIRPADPRAPALFLQIRLPRRNAVHRQRQPPRRRKRLGAFIDQPLGDQFVGHHAAQILGRLRLHPRGDFFGK
jgi:hypothetical protein